MRGVLADPVMAAWFDGSGTVHNERELAGLDGRLVRPDRVVFHEDRIAVIDFKTAEDPEDEQREKDAAQVRGYMQAIARRDSRPVHGYLYYSALGECQEVQLL